MGLMAYQAFEIGGRPTALALPHPVKKTADPRPNAPTHSAGSKLPNEADLAD